MRTVLVAEFENKKDASVAAKYLLTLRSKVRMMKEEEYEDSLLAKLIDEGMEEEGEVPIEKIYKKLRK